MVRGSARFVISGNWTIRRLLFGAGVMEAAGARRVSGAASRRGRSRCGLVAGRRGVSDQSVVRSGQRTGRGAALVSIDGAGRSAAYRKRQDQRHAAVSLSGSPAPPEEQNRTALEATLWGVVPGGV